MSEERRRIVAYIATSADGFIARKDGSVEWLHRPRTAGDYVRLHDARSAPPASAPAD